MTFIADLFAKLRTPKNVKGPFDWQHGQRVQTVLQSEPQHRCHI